MIDHEKMFTDNVFEQMIVKVKGKVTAYVRDDILYIKVENHDFIFERTYDNFAGKIMNGFTSQYAVYEFCKAYSKFAMNRFFRY